MDNPTEIGGFDENGEPLRIEIDESKFLHRKYHIRKWRESHWVFGGVERGTGKCFMVEVPNRTTVTLEQKISQFILPGMHIISDGWSAYRNIGSMNGGIYTHSVVNCVNFTNLEDGEVHTQSIEFF